MVKNRVIWTLRMAIRSVLDNPCTHADWCAYPDGPCGGMGGSMCFKQQRHHDALKRAEEAFNETAP